MMKQFAYPKLGLFILFCIVILITLLAANVGAMALSFNTLWQLPLTDNHWQIWLTIRLPRILLALLVGCALAVAGAVMQGLFRNPLADPGLLGISSGAALGVALFIVLPFPSSSLLSDYGYLIAAFAGGFIIAIVIFSLTHYSNGHLTKLLLSGIAINTLCVSFIGVLSYISDDQQLRSFTLWMMGSLSQNNGAILAIAATIISLTILITLQQSKKLNLLQLGDEEAHYLGLKVKKTKFILLLLSSLLIGCTVALSGIIGFIGLVVPHLIRISFGANHKWLLPACALAGAALLLTADTIARTIATPAEIPVGLITGLIGAPYFLYLILKQSQG